MSTIEYGVLKTSSGNTVFYRVVQTGELEIDDSFSDAMRKLPSIANYFYASLFLLGERGWEFVEENPPLVFTFKRKS